MAALNGSEGRKRVNRGDRARVIGIRCAVGMDGPAWSAGLSSLSLLFFQNSKRIGRKKREKGKRLEKGLWHADNFPGFTKMSLNQEK